jgi:hypothetical protein
MKPVKQVDVITPSKHFKEVLNHAKDDFAFNSRRHARRACLPPDEPISSYLPHHNSV